MSKVSIDRGILQAVLNILRTDAAEGRAVRGELAKEIKESITEIPQFKVHVARMIESSKTPGVDAPHITYWVCIDNTNHTPTSTQFRMTPAVYEAGELWKANYDASEWAEFLGVEFKRAELAGFPEVEFKPRF